MEKITQIDLSSIFPSSSNSERRKTSHRNSGLSQTQAESLQNAVGGDSPKDPLQIDQDMMQSSSSFRHTIKLMRLRRGLSFLIDVSIIVVSVYLIIILGLVFGSYYWGDYIHLLDWVQGHISITSIFVYVSIITFYVLYMVIIPILSGKTPGMYIVGLAFKVNNMWVLVHRQILGTILDLVFLPITIMIFLFKGQTLADILFKVRIEQIDFKKENRGIRWFLGSILVIMAALFTVGIFHKNLFFIIGKKLTNYDNLALYAVKSKNIGLLSNILTDYEKYSKNGAKYLGFYKCYVQINQSINTIEPLEDEKTCINELLSPPDGVEEKQIYGLIATYYDRLERFTEALKYYRFFFDNKIIETPLFRFLALVDQLMPDKISKYLNDIFEDVLNSDNTVVKYQVALLLYKNRKFPKAITLLENILAMNDKKVDPIEVKKYLAEALFYNYQYQKALAMMKEVAEKDEAYMPIYKSYLKYYNTQIKGH